MNSFLDLFLASLAGITVYHLVENVYYDIKARIHGRQHQAFWDDLEDELDL
jgi:hypothetical protein